MLFFGCFFYMTTNKIVGNLTATSILRWIPQFCVSVSVQLTSGVFLRRAYPLSPLTGRLQNTNRLQDLDWPVKFGLRSTNIKCAKNVDLFARDLYLSYVYSHCTFHNSLFVNHRLETRGNLTVTLNYQSQNIIIIFLGGGLFCFLIVKLFILHTNSTSRLQSSYLLTHLFD